MTPYLTTRGRWVLLSGAIFLIVGAALSNPFILVLGQIQIATLAVAFMLLVPGALVLDRRRVKLEIVERDQAQQNTESRRVTGMVVGERLEGKVCVQNPVALSLYQMRLRPFASPELEIEPIEGFVDVPGHHEVGVDFELGSQRCGRWTVHGFDVVISDPLGLLETVDYLPSTHHYEFYPRVIRARRGRMLPRGGAMLRSQGGRQIVKRLGMGTDVMELREHQPGDPLRHIAWKPTARHRKLISKNFEQEVSRSVYLLLDVSSSMRGGQHPGQKLDHAIEQAVQIAQQVISRRDSVGMMTFDEKLYGHIQPGTSPQHLRRILHHLVGLNVIRDGDLTEFDEAEVEQMIVDYLLVQERLDFRKGKHVDPSTGINSKLLRQWLRGVLSENRERFDSEALHEGLREEKDSVQRRFAQLRGLQIPYRVEARLGMKERGLVEALEVLIKGGRGRKVILVISDLCGILNLDLLSRGVRLARQQGHVLKFLVPFTPSFYEEAQRNEKYSILKELFGSAEREERLVVASKLRSLGVEVEFSAPAAVVAQARELSLV